jgi:hypothetical protein
MTFGCVSRWRVTFGLHLHCARHCILQHRQHTTVVNGNRLNGVIQCNLAALDQLYVVQSKRTSVQTADWSVGLLDRCLQ